MSSKLHIKFIIYFHITSARASNHTYMECFYSQAFQNVITDFKNKKDTRFLKSEELDVKGVKVSKEEHEDLVNTI